MPPGDTGPQAAPSADNPGPAPQLVLEGALERMEKLTEQLTTIGGQLAVLRYRGDRTRKLAWLCMCSLTVDIALTIVIAVVSVNASNQDAELKSQQAAIHAQQAAVRASQLNACAIGNQARADQIRLWGFFLQLAASSPKTNPGSIADLRKFVDTTFKPVNCTKLYPPVKSGGSAPAASVTADDTDEAAPAFRAGRMRPAP